MAFPEYQLRQFLQMEWIREREDGAKWIFGKRKKVSSALSLEDEIYRLRCELERLVQEGHDLTSPVVVEISTLLDKKINQYMQEHKNR